MVLAAWPRFRLAAWGLLACLAVLAALQLPAAEAHAELPAGEAHAKLPAGEAHAGLPVGEAHAELLASYPAPGARLASTPTEIRLTFSERIGASSRIQLFGPQFRPVRNVTSGLDLANPEQLRAFPPQLAPDIYTVEWSAASLDGHEVSGSYAFEVTGAAGPRLPVWLLVGGALAVVVLVGAVWVLARRRQRRGAAGAS